jgi:hypothetical protein
MTHIAGRRVGNATVPYEQTTKRTKLTDLTSGMAASWSGAGTLTVYYATGVAYADSNGVWKLSFNIGAYCTVAFTSESIAIDGTTFKNTTNGFQSLSIMQSGAPNTNQCSDAYTAVNGNTLTVRHATANASFAVSGDVELASEPSWAAANMEGMVDANVFVTGAGRGLNVVPISVTGSTPSIDSLATEKHYIVDMSSATGDVTLHAPSGVTDSKFRVSVDYGTATNTYHVLIDAYDFSQNGVIGSPLRVGQIVSWVYCTWNAGEGHYVVEDGSTFTMRTLEGDWTLTGSLKATGIYDIANADYTITDTDGILTVVSETAMSAARTITLPSAANNNGRILNIKKNDSGNYELTIQDSATGADLIDGRASIMLSFRYSYVTLQSNGSTWLVTAYKNETGTITPTLSLGTFKSGFGNAWQDLDGEYYCSLSYTFQHTSGLGIFAHSINGIVCKASTNGWQGGTGFKGTGTSYQILGISGGGSSVGSTTLGIATVWNQCSFPRLVLNARPTSPWV